MGRTGVSIHDEGRWVFNRIAVAYHGRPPYPPALVARLAELAGPGGPTADLGAGVGHLALPLAAAGAGVTAVEPARRMLDELVRLASARRLPVAAVHATAEHTGLGPRAFALLLLADVLHWVEPRATGDEVARLAARHARLAVVEIELEPTPFVATLVDAARRMNPRAFPRRREPARARRAHLLAAAGAATPAREVFADTRVIPPAEIPALLASLSFIGPALGGIDRARLSALATGLAEAAGGAEWARRIVLHHARLR